MSYQDLIQTIDHRVRLWLELLAYADKEIEVKDPAHNVEINIKPHEDRQIVSIPTIQVTFADDIPLEQLAAIALDLINELAQSSLEDFCDFHMAIDFDHTKRSFVIKFNSYNIRKD